MQKFSEIFESLKTETETVIETGESLDWKIVINWLNSRNVCFHYRYTFVSLI